MVWLIETRDVGPACCRAEVEATAAGDPVVVRRASLLLGVVD
jgi:hypothetical protein